MPAVLSGSARCVHGALHYGMHHPGHCCEQGKQEIDGEDTTHRGHQSTTWHSRRNTREKACHDEDEKPGPELDHRGTLEPRGPGLCRKQRLNSTKVVCSNGQRNCNQEELHEQNLAICGLPES